MACKICGCVQARNLLKAGYHVTVWNRSPEKCKLLEAEGASVAASPEEAAAACDITIAMLADPPAALAVAEQAAKGLFKGEPAQFIRNAGLCNTCLSAG